MARMDEDALFSTMRDKLFTVVVGECSTRRPRSERRMVQWVDQEKAIFLIREQKPKSSDANFVKHAAAGKHTHLLIGQARRRAVPTGAFLSSTRQPPR